MYKMKQIKIIDPSLLFFASDHHFGHENVIAHCDRPYSSVEEMDEDLIKKKINTSKGLLFQVKVKGIKFKRLKPVFLIKKGGSIFNCKQPV